MCGRNAQEVHSYQVTWRESPSPLLPPLMSHKPQFWILFYSPVLPALFVRSCPRMGFHTTATPMTPNSTSPSDFLQRSLDVWQTSRHRWQLIGWKLIPGKLSYWTSPETHPHVKILQMSPCVTASYLGVTMDNQWSFLPCIAKLTRLYHFLRRIRPFLSTAALFSPLPFWSWNTHPDRSASAHHMTSATEVFSASPSSHTPPQI